MILPCICQHKQQDELHGKGNRVHNKCKRRVPGWTPWRCTVCGRVQEIRELDK